MNATEQAIIGRVKAMQLPELRAKYQELYGEPTKGGAEYLRKRVATALFNAAGIGSAESPGDEETPAEHTARVARNEAHRNAIEAEVRGDFMAASESFALLAQLDPEDAAEHLERARDMRTRAVPPVNQPWGKTRTLPSSAPPPAAPEDTELLDLDRPPERVSRPIGQAIKEEIAKAEALEAAGDFDAASDVWNFVGTLDDRHREKHLDRMHEALVKAGRRELPTIEPPSSFSTSAEVKKPEARSTAATKHTDRRVPPVGTVLKRTLETGGQVLALVTVDGFTIEKGSAWGKPGEFWKSLSGIGRACTGKNTNGFIWFGLTEECPPGMSAADGAVLSPVTEKWNMRTVDLPPEAVTPHPPAARPKNGSAVLPPEPQAPQTARAPTPKALRDSPNYKIASHLRRVAIAIADLAELLEAQLSVLAHRHRRPYRRAPQPPGGPYR